MRIVLVFNGGSVTVHEYRRKMPLHLVHQKMVEIATQLFKSWEFLNGPPGIRGIGTGSMLITTSGSGEAPCL